MTPPDPERGGAFRLPKSGMPGAVFPAVPNQAASAMLAVLHQFRRTERLSPPELRGLQLQQATALVEHALRTTPFYKHSLRIPGWKPGSALTHDQWREIPILKRERVQEAGAALHSNAPPASHGSLAAATTSGTSGRPVTVRKTALAQFFWQCFVMREQEWRDRDPGRPWMVLLRDEQRKDVRRTGPLRRLADWGEPISAVYPTGPGGILDYRADVSELLEILVRERPAYLTTFPSLLRELLRQSAAVGARPEGLIEVRTTGEALDPDLAVRCRELWGAEVSQVYSASDVGIIAIPCREANVLHAQSEGSILEVLGEDDAPCAPGEEGRVVLTPLHNFAMPLLRYEIGDRAIPGDPCVCGRSLPTLAAIPGRARDMLSLPDGTRRFPYYGHGEIMRVDAITQHQVAQVAADRVELRLVVRRPLTPGEESRILAAAREALGPALQASISYRAAIPRMENGKFAEFTNETTAH